MWTMPPNSRSILQNIDRKPGWTLSVWFITCFCLNVFTFFMFFSPTWPDRFYPIPSGLVWEMENSSGWKRIEGDFGKF
jgi:hypothetical protein